MMLRSKNFHPRSKKVASLRSKTSTKTSISALRSVLSTAIALALGAGFGGYTGKADAAGLGRLSVQSALGQPLRAEVEVTALSKEEVGNVTAKLASQDQFKQAGLELNPALQNLRFTIEKRADGRHFVKITSVQPINEPFVDLMVELNWPAGRFVREYTFLLDPAELRVGQTIAGGETRQEPVVAPVLSAVTPQAPVVSRPVLAAPIAATTPPVAATTPTVAATTPRGAPPVVASPKASVGTDAPGDYTTKRGDTLASVASKYKTTGVSIEQAIVAIYRANPNAFLGNVNRMKAGAPLSIPDQAAMSAITVAQARQEPGMSGFKSYRSRLASAAKPGRVMAKAGQSAQGQIGGAAPDVVAKATAQDRLKLSNGTASSGKAATTSMGSSAKESSIAQSAAMSEASSRITALEKNVKDLQALLTAKDKQLADLEARLKTAAVAGKSAEGVVGKAAPPMVAVVPAKPDVAKIDPIKTDASKVELPKVEAAKSALPKIDAPKDPLSKFDTPVVAKTDVPKIDVPKIDVPKIDVPKIDPPKLETAKVDVAKTDVPKIDTPKVDTPKVDAPKVIAKVPPVPAPVAETSLLDTIQNDYPYALPGLGGVALLGAGYAAYAMRRRKKAEKFEDSLMEGEAFSANSLFGTTGGQSVDTSAALATPTRSTETGVEVGSTEVDPIAEAEVYIAYGREGQAEEILKEALRKQADRQAIRLKLLEIYAGRKDAVAFETLAREMHEQTNGRNEEWPKVETLGLAIDPNNSLYAGKNAQARDAQPKNGMGGALAAGAGVLGASAFAIGKSATDRGIDSLQAASQIVPPIPDFMAEQKSVGSQAFGGVADVSTTLSEPEALDFDFNPKTTISRAAERLPNQTPEAAKPAKSLASFDLPSLDLGSKSTSFAADPVTDFSIDLPALEQLTGTGKQAGRSTLEKSHTANFDFGTTAIATPVSSGTQSAAWQEMATKLDLASAYEEIGDKDGARELLDEVLKGGDQVQQQKARGMLAKIS